MGLVLATLDDWRGPAYTLVPGTVQPDAPEVEESPEADAWRDFQQRTRILCHSVLSREPAQDGPPPGTRWAKAGASEGCRAECEKAALLPGELGPQAAGGDPAAPRRPTHRRALAAASACAALLIFAAACHSLGLINLGMNSFMALHGQERSPPHGPGALGEGAPARPPAPARRPGPTQPPKALERVRVPPISHHDHVPSEQVPSREHAPLRMALAADSEDGLGALASDQSVQSVTFEAETASRDRAGSTTGASVSFFCGGSWTPPRAIFSRVAAGDSVRRELGPLPQWPTKLKVIADGVDEWGFRSIVLRSGGMAHVVLSSADGQALGDNQYWVGTKAGPLQEYSVPSQYRMPSLSGPPRGCGGDNCTLRADGAKAWTASKAGGNCSETASHQGKCSESVMWAMSHGIWEHPEWYPGLGATSSFEEFQALLHAQGHGGCPRPCGAAATFHRGVPGSSVDVPGTSGARRELTFYVYRLEVGNSTTTLHNANVADLETVMAQLHAEVGEQHGKRAAGVLATRISRIRLTMKATWSIFRASGRQFGPYVEFDRHGRCADPGCDRFWEEFGFPVGCRLRTFEGFAYGTSGPVHVTDQAAQATSAEYSLPGPCPSGACSTGAEAAQVPGGACVVVTGAPDCTYHVEEAGSVSVDELMGVTDPAPFLQGSKRMYDPETDAGTGCSFWDGRSAARLCAARASKVKFLFKSKYKHLPDCDLLAPPLCDAARELQGELQRLERPAEAEAHGSAQQPQRLLPVVKPYVCSSNFEGLPMAAVAQKGLTLDDSTFLKCSHLLPQQWPHTGETVQALRLFKSWDPAWDDRDRENAWGNIVDYVNSNRAKVLMGTQLTCNETDDDRDWNLTVQLMERIGPKLVMGVSFGNELELLQFKEWVTPECAQSLWDLEHGYVVRKLKERVRSLDSLPGFSGLPVTTVLTGMALNGDPFYEVPQARIQTLLSTVTAHLGRRWVFSFNFYPYFDPTSQLDPGTTDRCQETMRRARCFDAVGCSTIEAVAAARAKMAALTGQADWPLWISELGWSWPMSTTLNTPMSECPSFSSEAMFRAYYEGFLTWDLRVTSEALPPDMVFYFTIRDSDNAGYEEHFGLIGRCTDSRCKMEANATKLTMK